MPFIDISHKIESGLITYPGLPAPLICDFLSREESHKAYEDGSTFSIQKIEMVGNTGTYIDCPFHRYEDGKDFSEISINKLANLPGVVVRVPFHDKITIDKEDFLPYDVKGKAVLIHSGWDIYWQNDKYFQNHPFLTQRAAEYLLEEGVLLVGIDSLNIDDTRTNARPVHSILLRADIPIIEHLTNLINIPDENFKVTAVPPKIAGVGSFPVRAFVSY